MRGGTGRTAPRTIRTRLLRILVLVLAVLLALLGAVASEQISACRNAAVTADHARLEITLQRLVHELQKERGLTTGYVGGVRQFGAGLPAQRRATDTARARLDRALKGCHDVAADSVRESLGRLAGLTGVRRHADDGTGVVKDTFDYFTTTITTLGRLGLGLDDAHDGRLRAAFQAFQVLGNAKEFTGEERAIVLGSVRAGRFRGDDYSRFLQIRAGRLAALESFPRAATEAQQLRLDAALTTPDAARALAYESVVVHGAGRLTSRDVPPMSWWESMTSTIDGLRDVQLSLGKDVETRATGLEGAARRDLLLFMLFALGTVAALGRLALDCVRSVYTPLAALAQQAREVADRRLPRAVAAVQSGIPGEHPGPPASLSVPDRAGAEVLDVAEAFDRVQRAAFDLATEQAVLRRNQNLVRRQIGFTAEREHEDADPATLADVLRTALSEVQEYRRVTLRRIETAHITGSVVAEVAHLLGELIENGLSFSSPDSEVEIEGRHTGAGYLMAIVTHGLGMDAEALAEANLRLSGTAGFMAGPTRFLGHFVVGVLARRCGIEVRLGEAPGAAVVARVLIPTSLLTQTPAERRVPEPPAEPAAPKPVLPAPRTAVEDCGLPGAEANEREMTR
ncbi:ATP-binding protein [Streptomyces sp. NPDC001795]|uniref:sensor histidine kinase n=1 Tax=unclassified Streptomyces TaxID=2593676 RepID=UPI00332876D1